MSNERNEQQIEEQIQEFVDEHGVEGFYVAYFTEFISHFILQELKSPPESGPGTSPIHTADIGTVRQIKQNIRKRSEFWAREIVDDLDERGDLESHIESGKIDEFLDPDEFQSIVDNTFDDWNARKEELIQDVQDKYGL